MVGKIRVDGREEVEGSHNRVLLTCKGDKVGMGICEWSEKEGTDVAMATRNTDRQTAKHVLRKEKTKTMTENKTDN